MLLKCDAEQRAWLLCDLLFAPRIDKPYSIIKEKCLFLPLKVDDRGITSGTFTLPLRDVLDVGLGEGSTIYVVLRSGKTHSFYVENKEVMEKTIRGFLTSPRHIFEQVREAYLGLASMTLPGGQTIPDDMIRYILKLSYGAEDGI